VLCACSNDPSALYRQSAGDAGSAEATDVHEAKAPPILPAQPDPDHVSACEACARDNCVKARAGCLGDDACTAQLECSGACSDPGCLQRCAADTGVEGQWSIWWEDLFVCAYQMCETECNTGQNWACEDHFDWPSAEQQTIRVHARFQGWDYSTRLGFDFGNGEGGADFSGAHVSVCNTSDSCSGGVSDQGVLDAASSAWLELPAPFRSHFELVRGTLQYRVHYLPIARPIDVPMFLLDYYLGGTTFAIGWVPSDQSAALWAKVTDCTGVLGRNVRVELPNQAQAKVAYLTSGGTLDLAAHQTATGFAFVPEVDVPTGGRIAISAVFADGDQTVAERTLPMRDGWITALSLGPRSRSGD
jgi:hypothetical protein